MAPVGTVQLLAFSFERGGPLPAAVAAQVRMLRADDLIDVLDVLLVSKDEYGALGFETDTTGIDVWSVPSGSTLRQLFDEDDADAPSTATLELLSSREIGLDLDALENFAHYLEPDTTTLLLLLEATWAMTLRETALAAGGAPIVFACLEPETMLMIGPQLMRAAEARSRSRAAAVAGLVITSDNVD